jgi:hypothetical protein
VSLSSVSGGGTVQPWRHRPSTALHVAYPPRQTQPSWNVVGGGTGCVHRGVAQARHCKSHEHRGKGVFTVATPRHITANHQTNHPPPLRRTKQTCNGGGGTEDVRGGVIHAGTESRLSPPLTSLWRRTSTALNVLAYPHPNHTSCPGQKNYIRLTYFR